MTVEALLLAATTLIALVAVVVAVVAVRAVRGLSSTVEPLDVLRSQTEVCTERHCD